MILMPDTDPRACYMISLFSEAEEDERKWFTLMRKMREKSLNLLEILKSCWR